jgi:hypothetical protein
MFGWCWWLRFGKRNHTELLRLPQREVVHWDKLLCQISLVIHPGEAISENLKDRFYVTRVVSQIAHKLISI